MSGVFLTFVIRMEEVSVANERYLEITLVYFCIYIVIHCIRVWWQDYSHKTLQISRCSRLYASFPFLWKE